MKKQLIIYLMVLWAGILVIGCDDGGSDNDSDASSDTDTDTDSGDTDTDTDSGDTDTDTDSGDTDTGVDYDSTGEQGIGSSCYCEGSECDQGGVPKPAKGTIVGCDDVPDVVNAETVCLRSFSGDLANDTYFAEGFCAVQATACDGNSMICNNAVWGTYDAMDTCPADSVLLSFDVEVTVYSVMNATISNKICAPSCDDDTDCRQNVADSVHDNAMGQYQCITHADENGGDVKFCYDVQNLPAAADYTATSF